MKYWMLALIWIGALGLVAGEVETNKAKIDSLLMAVEKSDAKFVRNGDEHTGKEAAEHMRRKYDHFKKEIKTPDDFIAKCAAKSELSGKPYMVKTADGKSVKCEEWMKARLQDLEKPKTKAAE